ncbi:acyclic terpene utilization AtuA family protein [Cryobacterium sp. TMT1-66-1]|uniref:acyclic terpene utilization AtuA family protein n=1 Tax=Cryobacterium sp. TMT1-66-1 TaxID=1259242 RepID=UPI0018E073FA|nr:acyclic terpene utilization AtuA family protein [Cryobacterium sp. TMT1-66-1]
MTTVPATSVVDYHASSIAQGDGQTHRGSREARGVGSSRDRAARGTAVGHLLECARQLTGGYYADPVTKPVPNLPFLGFRATTCSAWRFERRSFIYPGDHQTPRTSASRSRDHCSL